MKHTKKYPTRDECLSILRKFNCPKKVIRHILVVTELALKIAQYFPEADLELLEAGALLHDLGRSRSHDVNHAVVGSEMARRLGLPDEVVHIIEHHIAAGIPKAEAVKLGLPAKDYTPRTLEERIVAHADNLVEYYERCTIERSVQVLTEKGLPEAAARIKQMHLELSCEAGIDLDKIQ
ncbi:HD domain-containing protein [[Eubacterium] cellulosolvens]